MTKKVKHRRKRKAGTFACDFCGKKNEDVECLVIGPRVNICNACVSHAIVACVERGVDVVEPAMEAIKGVAEAMEQEE